MNSTNCMRRLAHGQGSQDLMPCVFAGYAISASLLEGVLSDANGPLVSYPSNLFEASFVDCQSVCHTASPCLLCTRIAVLAKKLSTCGPWHSSMYCLFAHSSLRPMPVEPSNYNVMLLDILCVPEPAARQGIRACIVVMPFPLRLCHSMTLKECATSCCL